MGRQKRQNMVFLLFCGGLLIWFLADAGEVRQAAAEALRLCASSVIPALFPFLAVTSTLISLGFGEIAAPLLSPLMTPLFRLPGQAGGALVLGFLGGYPIGAKAAADLYQAGALTKDEAERLLGFCNHANPAFLISVLGNGVFGSTRTGIWLLLIHVFSALLTGFFFRGKKRNAQAAGAAIPRNPSGASRRLPLKGETGAKGAVSAFVESVSGAAAVLLRVCAFVVFFYVLAFPLRALDSPRKAAFVGLLDLFSFTPLLTRDTGGFVTAAACSAFGGLGVFCQTAAALEHSGLSPRGCAVGKALQGVLAGFCAAGLCASGLVRF